MISEIGEVTEIPVLIAALLHEYVWRATLVRNRGVPGNVRMGDRETLETESFAARWRIRTQQNKKSPHCSGNRFLIL